MVQTASEALRSTPRVASQSERRAWRADPAPARRQVIRLENSDCWSNCCFRMIFIAANRLAVARREIC